MTSGEGETSKVKEPYDAFEIIRDQYGQLTHERFMKQGGVGIYRRFIYWVPAFGEGSIDREHSKVQDTCDEGVGRHQELAPALRCWHPWEVACAAVLLP